MSRGLVFYAFSTVWFIPYFVFLSVLVLLYSFQAVQCQNVNFLAFDMRLFFLLFFYGYKKNYHWLSRHHLRHMSGVTTSLYYATAKFGSCWNHVWLCFTSRPLKTLNFSRLKQYGLQNSPWRVYFLGPYQCHVWTGLGLY